MKNKIISYTNFLVLMFLPLCFMSCNDDSKSRKDDGDSFFGSLFSSGADLDIASEDISEKLNNLGKELLNNEELSNFYKNRSNSAVWNDASLRNSFYDELEQADEEGLEFQDYHGKDLQELMKDPAELSDEEQAQLEILLTDAFLEYGSHLWYGKLDPEKIYKYWGIKRKPRDLKEVLSNAIEEGDTEQALADLRPNHQVYRDLKTALKEYEQLKEEEYSITEIPEGELIRPGDKDDRIAAIVTRLQELEFLNKNYTSEENAYSDEIQKAVEDFQNRKGLDTDAIIGNSTIRELNMNPEDRYHQILANLERWRWYPRELGDHYILINIPAFELTVVKDHDTVRTHNVIAGTKERPTPIFSDSLQYIVLNPEWNIPPTIKSEDIIPAASSDPQYLRNKNITVRSSDGESIDPSTIDWSSDEVQSYRFVQESGPTNPLGRIKIIYPNDYAIYLHDTPSQSLFQQNERAESSGCVRVQNVLDLAAYLLDGQDDWDMEKINETIQSGKTVQVPIKSPVRVHHFYWTAWRDNGKTVFTEDVYDLDRGIYTSLQEN